MSTGLVFLLVFLVCFLGATIQSTVGFGFLIIIMGVMPMFLPVSQALVMGHTVGIMLSFILIADKLKKLDIKYILFPVIFGTAGAIAGMMFLSDISVSVYMKLLGIVLVVLALWMWKFSRKVKIRATYLNGGICGLIAGIMGAVFGVCVPPLVLYYSSDMRDKDRYMVALQATLGIQSLSCNVCRACFGMWPAGVWKLVPFALAGALLGLLPGKWIYGKLNVERLKQVIYVFIALMGIYTFLSN